MVPEEDGFCYRFWPLHYAPVLPAPGRPWRRTAPRRLSGHEWGDGLRQILRRAAQGTRGVFFFPLGRSGGAHLSLEGTDYSRPSQNWDFFLFRKHHQKLGVIPGVTPFFLLDTWFPPKTLGPRDKQNARSSGCCRQRISMRWPKWPRGQQSLALKWVAGLFQESDPRRWRFWGFSFGCPVETTKIPGGGE